MNLIAMSPSDFTQITLTLSAWTLAEEFAAQQANFSKARQVYFNTLAVLALNNYLQYLGWETSLESSNSWDRSLRALLNATDLDIFGYGKLECCLVEPGDRAITIPEIINPGTIAYVAININKAQKLAYLWGFLPKFASRVVSIANLHPMSDFPQYLAESQDKATVLSSLPKLGNWLLGKVEAGWHTLDSLKKQQPSFSFRLASATANFRTVTTNSPSGSYEQEMLNEGISRVKLWEIGKSGQDYQIAVVISLSVGKQEELEISIKICPTSNQDYLPQGLIVTILDEEKQPILQAQTKPTNEMVEFFLNGEPGEVFSIEATLEEARVLESFMI